MYRRCDRIGVHRRERRVPGAHRLKERECFLAPHLTYQQILGTLPERTPEQFVHVDCAALISRECVPRHARNPVRVWELQFPRVFERHDLCLLRYE